MLEKDIQTGQHLTELQMELATSMLAELKKPAILDEEIVGDVAL